MSQTKTASEATEGRPRVSLDLPDLSGFKPQARPQAPADPHTVARVAEDAGFRTRHAATKTAVDGDAPAPFDARSLRRSRRTAQLNIALEQDTRERFWMLAQDMGVTSGEEALVQLIEAYETLAAKRGARSG